MLTNQPVLEQIISELNIPLTPGALKGMIKISVISNTQMLRATVEDTNPQRAADIANRLSSVFVRRIQNLQGERYSSSLADLENQIKSMEDQINKTSQELQAAKDWQATQGWQPTQALRSQSETVLPTQTLRPTPVLGRTHPSGRQSDPVPHDL